MLIESRIDHETLIDRIMIERARIMEQNKVPTALKVDKDEAIELWYAINAHKGRFISDQEKIKEINGGVFCEMQIEVLI